MSGLKTIINEGRKLPDGLVLDVAAGHIYWTNMGDPNRNDGSIMRSDLNGKNMITIVPPGGTFTPKQLQLGKTSGKLYWSDREGMRVMRANLDGSEIETLVDTSVGDSRPGSDQKKWCVGIAVDTDGGKFDANSCEFTNEVQSPFTPELLDCLAKQGIPQDVFQAARKPVSEAHNRQEAPLFAKRIERHALSSASSAAVAHA